MVIRIPLRGGYLWETYGADWAQLDAPRHFTLFTKIAFLRTVDDLGLKAQNITFDAEAFRSWPVKPSNARDGCPTSSALRKKPNSVGRSGN